VRISATHALGAFEAKTDLYKNQGKGSPNNGCTGANQKPKCPLGDVKEKESNVRHADSYNRGGFSGGRYKVMEA